jgi:hypothetical protein
MINPDPQKIQKGVETWDLIQKQAAPPVVEPPRRIGRELLKRVVILLGSLLLMAVLFILGVSFNLGIASLIWANAPTKPAQPSYRPRIDPESERARQEQIRNFNDWHRKK